MERCKVVIAAAGMSSRMQMGQPKALLLVGQYTLIERLVNEFDGCEVIVIVGFGGDKVRSYLSAVGKNVVFVEQVEMRGSGDAVKQARDLIGREKFWVSWCDHIVKLPVVNHDENVIGVKRMMKTVDCGIVDVDGQYVVSHGKRVNPEPDQYVFSGVVFFGEPEYAWSKIDKYDDIDDALNEMAHERRLTWVEMPLWVPIGSKEEYEDFVRSAAFLSLDEV